MKESEGIMKPGQVVVARLGKGATVVRYVDETQSRITVALGRNRQARIPRDRILLATDLVVSDQEEFEEFCDRGKNRASTIDLTELWEVVRDEESPMSAEDLGDLYWGSSKDAVKMVALVLHIEQDSDYFVYEKDGYVTRTPDELEEIQARRRREAENEAAAESLMRSLTQGALPEPLTHHHHVMLQHLRNYAVHGDDYNRNYAAESLMKRIAQGTRDLQRHCFELLVRSGVFAEDEPLELYRAGIDDVFPEDALAEATSIELPALLAGRNRMDLTALNLITIDDADTEDRDDALSLEMGEMSQDEPRGDFRIGIHVTDAGALIPLSGAIDQEADRRMATLYMPERKIEMLPPDFTYGVGSLDPGKTRFAMSILVHVTESLEVSDWEVTPSVVRSRAALSYEDADQALEGKANPWHHTLTRLNQMGQALKRKREEAGAVVFEQVEMDIKVRPSGKVDVKVSRRTPAREMVAELMILCNTLLAEYCREHQVPAAYRSQPAADLSDLVTGGQELPGALLRYLIVKRLQPAKLGITPTPHGGLGVEAYVQATSPLRRYPDLVIQRQISQFLHAGKPLYSPESLESIAQRAEVQLRELARLEEQRKRYWFLKYLDQISRLGAAEAEKGSDLFDAVVLENEPRRKAILELIQYPFRVRAELPSSIGPGDTAKLKLMSVDLWQRVGRFVHVATSN